MPGIRRPHMSLGEFIDNEWRIKGQESGCAIQRCSFVITDPIWSFLVARNQTNKCFHLQSFVASPFLEQILYFNVCGTNYIPMWSLKSSRTPEWGSTLSFSLGFYRQGQTVPEHQQPFLDGQWGQDEMGEREMWFVLYAVCCHNYWIIIRQHPGFNISGANSPIS